METESKYRVFGMHCAACAANVERLARSVAAVQSAEVNLVSGILRVTWKNTRTDNALFTAISQDGRYSCQPENLRAGSETNRQEIHEILQRFLPTVTLWLAVFCLAQFAMHTPRMQNSALRLLGVIQAILTLVIFWWNRQVIVSGWTHLFSAPDMNTLIALGNTAAFFLSVGMLWYAPRPRHLYFEAAGMILAVTSFGKLLEAYAKCKAGNALDGLRALIPVRIHRKQGGQWADCELTQVQLGDILQILPGEYLPLDGIVVSGTSSVNESVLTGESIPRELFTGEKAFAGTLNLSGTFQLRVTRLGGRTLLDSIIQAVEQAGIRRNPWVRLADRAAAVFVPVVLLLALVTLFAWIIASAPFSQACAHAIAVLVISCPCALGLATPLASVMGTLQASRQGILFKNPEALEKLAAAQAVFLDKTGTITTGMPRVTDVLAEDEDGLLVVAAAVECQSSHPFAYAIRKEAEDRCLEFTEATEVQTVPGKGVRGIVFGQGTWVGTADFAQVLPLPQDEQLRRQGKSVLYVRCGETTGAIAVRDMLVENAAEVVRLLREKLLCSVTMLSGDGTVTARAIGEEAGIADVQAEMLPVQKGSLIRETRLRGKITVMVGDGMNDSPALAEADCGIAIGTGTDIAKDCADVILLSTAQRIGNEHSSPHRTETDKGAGFQNLPNAIWISRQVLRNIRQNLFWAFFYNFCAIPIAAGVLLPLGGFSLTPSLGAICMSCSSLFVVGNALRLLRMRKLTA